MSGSSVDTALSGPSTDVTAPALDAGRTRLSALDPTRSVLVQFDEAVDALQATDVTNYTISGLGNPDSVLKLGARTVRATWNAGVSAGLTVDVTMSDLATNASGLMSRVVQAVDTNWVLAWQGAANGQVLVDEVAFGDCGDAVLAEGLKPQIVPAPLQERIDLAGDTSALIVDLSEVPEGWTIGPGHPRPAWNGTTWFGRIERVEELPFTGGRSGVWLAFGPHEDRTGTLREALTVFSDRDINLTHLRSVALAGGGHAFFAAFVARTDTQLQDLLTGLDAEHIIHRVLALFPFEAADDAGELRPAWGGQ